MRSAVQPKLYQMPGNARWTFARLISKLPVTRTIPASPSGRGFQRKLHLRPSLQKSPWYLAWLLQQLHLMLIVHFKDSISCLFQGLMNLQVIYITLIFTHMFGNPSFLCSNLSWIPGT